MKSRWGKQLLAMMMTVMVAGGSIGTVTSLAADENEAILQTQDMPTGSWSEWSTEVPQAADNRKIESKIQYRYRDRSETTSSNSSLSGWTKYRTEPVWGSWSSYQDGYISGSDTVEVRTQSVFDHYNYTMGHYCTGNVSGAKYQTCYTNKSANETFNAKCVYHGLGTFSSLKDFYEYTTDIGVQDYLYKGSSKSTAYKCANTCFRWYVIDKSSVYKTQYSSRKVTSYTYYYYKWGSWSAWSEQTQTASDTRQVESQTLYRYMDVDGTISQCKITLEKDSYVYDGKAKTPAVTVTDTKNQKLKKDVDYTVSYSNNINAGTANVSVAGKGTQSGAKTLNFMITKAAGTAAFAEKNVSRPANKERFKNAFTTNSDGKITYTSANTSVAAVDASTGEVTPLSQGTTKITAQVEEAENYTSANAAYELKVTDYKIADINSLSFDFPNFTGTLSKEAFTNIYGDTVYAKNLYQMCARDAEGGTCYGMASASGLFNVSASGVTTKAFNNKSTIKELKLSDRSSSLNMNLKLFIQSMFTSQYSTQIQNGYKNNKNISELTSLTAKVEKGGEPVLIAVFGPQGGHALLGYKLVKKNSTTEQLYVYDCNYPHADKYITLTKSGNTYKGWSYKIGSSYAAWNQTNGRIAYIPYATYASLWTQNHKALSGLDLEAAAGTELSTNTYLINSSKFEVRDASGKVVATYADGIFNSKREDIFQFQSVDIVVDDKSASERLTEKNPIIYMPSDTYTLVNKDEDIFDFQITSVNRDQSSTVTTTADKVTIALSDQEKMNKVLVESENVDVYTASFDSSLTASGEIQTLNAAGVASDEDRGVTVGFDKDAEFTKTNMMGNDTSIAAKPDIKDLRMELDYREVRADGKEKKPKVTVYAPDNTMLKENIDYIVKYINNINAGTASLKVYGINEYTGVSKAEEYRIIGVDSSNESGKTEVKVSKTKISSLKKESKGFTAKWKKVSNVSGYQVQYSTSKKFTKSTTKTVTVKGGSATSKKVSKLKKKKTYYVKIRVYKTVKGKKYYSGWSTVKSVKTK